MYSQNCAILKMGGGGLCANEEVNKKALEFQLDAKRNRFIAAGRNCFKVLRNF